MSESKITGVIDAVSDYQHKDYFNVAIEDAERDDNWYIGNGSLQEHGEIEKGDKVRLHVDDNQGSITKIDILEDGGKDEKPNQNQPPKNERGEGSSPSSTYTSPEQAKRANMAVMQAAKTAREMHADESKGEHAETVDSLANLYYNKAEDLLSDEK